VSWPVAFARSQPWANVSVAASPTNGRPGISPNGRDNTLSIMPSVLNASRHAWHGQPANVGSPEVQTQERQFGYSTLCIMGLVVRVSEAHRTRGFDVVHQSFVAMAGCAG